MKRSTQRVSRRAFAAAGLGALTATGLPDVVFGQAPAVQGRSVPGEVEKANIGIVGEFCAAFDRRDLDKAVSLLADNCTYRVTQTRPPIVGKEKIAETLKGFMNRVVAFKVLKTVACGPVVVNERDDVFGAGTNQPARTFHVAAGVFFVENGKIVEWTDYVLQ